jgi:hypothetical protein
MKKILFGLLLALVGFDVAAQPLITPSQLDHNTFSFVRRTVCANGAGGNCGSNPPIHHILPSQCGTVISTSIARNEDGSTSTEGIGFSLPTVAEMTAAGFSGGGGLMEATGVANRNTQCFISFVMALPGPSSYLHIGFDNTAVQGTDKITFNYEGNFHDIFNGYLKIPFMGSSPITIAWNGTSWLLFQAPASIGAYFGYGSMASQGQGRLFRVTADPSWWTVGSKIGSLAYCPHNGLGTTAPSNGGMALAMLSPNCVFLDTAAGTNNYYITLRNVGSFTATGVAAGAAYIAGVAPNGTAYPAGNYIVITGGSTANFTTGGTITVHNLPMTLGSKTNGKWIGKLLTAPTTGCAVGTCFELHQEVRAESDLDAVSHIGPPSSFLPGDTLLSTVSGAIVAGGYNGLNAVSQVNGRVTNPANGSEEELGLRLRSILGMASTVGGVFVDAPATRNVASWFNPVEKRCQGVYTANRTTNSAVFVKPNAEADCTFSFLNRASSTANALGDAGDSVRYTLVITMSNDTAGAGCEASVGIDGVVAEPEIGVAMNPAGIANFKSTITISGAKSGLTETKHTISPLVRTVGGGICTVYSANTFNNSYIRQ